MHFIDMGIDKRSQITDRRLPQIPYILFRHI
jgi:hypothetical protein